MLNRVVFYFSFFILILSCNSQKEENDTKNSETLVQKAGMNKKPPSTFNDTLMISGKSAVFYFPDSIQNLSIKKVTDSTTFKALEHEIFYQMRYSRITLKKYYPGIRMKEAKDVRYLVFKKNVGEPTIIDLNVKDDAYGLLIFDGIQEPRLVDMTNVETDLGFYFKKK